MDCAATHNTHLHFGTDWECMVSIYETNCNVYIESSFCCLGSVTAVDTSTCDRVQSRAWSPYSV